MSNRHFILQNALSASEAYAEPIGLSEALRGIKIGRGTHLHEECPPNRWERLAGPERITDPVVLRGAPTIDA